MIGPGGVLDWLRQVTPDEVKAYYWAAYEVYASPWFYAGVGLILTLEWLRPAMRDQRILSPALWQDFLWFNLDLAFKVAALPAFAGLLQAGYTGVTGGFVLPVLSGLPVPARVGISFLIFDFLQWFHHWVRHRVTALWHFHVIHHSQRELNLFTDLRVHFAEYLAAQVLTFIPMFLLGLSPFAIVGTALAVNWYTRLIHANVRLNFGPLKHVLVTPQYHRIHHSIEPRHQDRNFGVIFTIWDRLFGTMYPHYDEYPATGVAGVEFAPAAGIAPAGWARDLARQNLYPFRQLVRGPSRGSRRTTLRPDDGLRGEAGHDAGPALRSPAGGSDRRP